MTAISGIGPLDAPAADTWMNASDIGSPAGVVTVPTTPSPVIGWAEPPSVLLTGVSAPVWAHAAAPSIDSMHASPRTAIMTISSSAFPRPGEWPARFIGFRSSGPGRCIGEHPLRDTGSAVTDAERRRAADA